MNKILFSWATYLVAFLVAPLTAMAQPITQISTSNLYCTTNSTGPYVVLALKNGQRTNMSISKAKNLINVDIIKDNQDIKLLQAAIDKKKNIVSNKKKLILAQKDLVFLRNVLKSLDACSKIGAFVSATPTVTPLPSRTRTPTPTPTVSSGTSGVISVSNYSQLSGAHILAKDGTYLGIFSNDPFSVDSISSRSNSYGSNYSSSSIFNRYGPYGSDFSSQSPWNASTSTPPILVISGVTKCYITNNTNLSPRVEPNDVSKWANRMRQ